MNTAVLWIKIKVAVLVVQVNSTWSYIPCMHASCSQIGTINLCMYIVMRTITTGSSQINSMAEIFCYLTACMHAHKQLTFEILLVLYMHTYM